MYTAAEQLVWRRAFDESRPRAVWLPHYPYPLARLLPGNRRMLTYVTVHDAIHVLPQRISGQSRARRLYARAMLSVDARSCRRIFTPSQATAATLKTIVPPRRDLVTPIPVDESLVRASRSESVARQRPLSAICRKHASATRTFRSCSRRSPGSLRPSLTSW